MVSLGNDWDGILEDEFRKEYYLRLRQILKQEYRTHTVYPSMYDLFNALRLTPCREVKAVILGQDPLTADPMALRDIPVLETIKDGRTIWPG